MQTITFKGSPLHLVGALPSVGQRAPDFTLLANDLTSYGLKDFAGKTLVIATVPSLDTPVCDTEIRRFNKDAAALSDKLRLLAVSCDLPFAQARWCGAAGISAVQSLSDHRDASFGQNYGVLIKELRLLARAIFIIDAHSVVRYVQLVPEMTSEPDYDAALNAAKAAV
ncbi:MAG: thiol peroxidase [Desulfovibrionaceae bacterium]|nr:thiol peroxidase [Desulfovibrionaceae bacterium]